MKKEYEKMNDSPCNCRISNALTRLYRCSALNTNRKVTIVNEDCERIDLRRVVRATCILEEMEWKRGAELETTKEKNREKKEKTHDFQTIECFFSSSIYLKT